MGGMRYMLATLVIVYTLSTNSRWARCWLDRRWVLLCGAALSLVGALVLSIAVSGAVSTGVSPVGVMVDAGETELTEAAGVYATERTRCTVSDEEVSYSVATPSVQVRAGEYVLVGITRGGRLTCDKDVVAGAVPRLGDAEALVWMGVVALYVLGGLPGLVIIAGSLGARTPRVYRRLGRRRAQSSS